MFASVFLQNFLAANMLLSTGHPHDLPPHMDPMGPMPLPPPGRGGYRMHPMAPYGHMHSRDMPPGRPFDPMSPRGMEEHRVYPRHGGGGGGRSGKVRGWGGVVRIGSLVLFIPISSACC